MVGAHWGQVVVNDAVVIDLSLLRGVEVVPATKTVTIAGGDNDRRRGQGDQAARTGATLESRSPHRSCWDDFECDQRRGMFVSHERPYGDLPQDYHLRHGRDWSIANFYEVPLDRNYGLKAPTQSPTETQTSNNTKSDTLRQREIISWRNRSRRGRNRQSVHGGLPQKGIGYQGGGSHDASFSLRGFFERRRGKHDPMS